MSGVKAALGAVSDPAAGATARVAVFGRGSHREPAARLAEGLGLPLLEEEGGWPGLLLRLGEAGLELVREGQNPLRLDLDRARRPVGQRDLLRRALGPGVRWVVDATAGWGADALQLALAGLRVTALEREPVVAAMLADGLRRCADPRVRENLEVVADDAVFWLERLGEVPDAVYIDPMFPPKRRRSAAARKEMALLQELTGGRDDEAALLGAALGAAGSRVVVKRPLRAPPVSGGPAPSGAVRGKLVRFDIYPPARGGEG